MESRIQTAYNAYKTELQTIYKRLEDIGANTNSLNKNCHNINMVLDTLDFGIYRPLEYIRSNGLQYIATNYVYNANTKVEVDYRLTTLTKPATTVSYPWGFGLGAYFGLQFANAATINQVTIWNGPSSSTVDKTLLVNTNRHKVVVDFGGYTIDGVRTTKAATYAANTNALCICAYGNNAGSYGTPEEVYGVKVYEGNTLKLCFVPCELTVNISTEQSFDGKIHYKHEVGMWETVSNKFYPNAGRGVFATPDSQYCTFMNYITNSSSSYILSNVPFKTAAKIDTLFVDNNSATTGYGAIYGTYTTGTALTNYLQIGYSNNRDMRFINPTTSNLLVPVAATPKGTLYEFNLDITANSLIVNGTTIAHSTAFGLPTASPNNIPIFAGYVTNAIQQYLLGNIYYFAVRDTSNNVLCYLVPAKIKVALPASMDSQGAARAVGTFGMWDKVSNKFFASKTTVAFTGA